MACGVFQTKHLQSELEASQLPPIRLPGVREAVGNCSAQTQGKLATSSAALSRPLQISIAFLSAHFYMNVYIFTYSFYFKASSNRKKVIEQ